MRKIRRHQVVINNGAIKADKRPGLYERHFWIFAFGVILISILTNVFDFSLKPPSYKGLFITRPYYGLHSWARANRAWAARSHIKLVLRSDPLYVVLYRRWKLLQRMKAKKDGGHSSWRSAEP